MRPVTRFHAVALATLAASCGLFGAYTEESEQTGPDPVGGATQSGGGAPSGGSGGVSGGEPSGGSGGATTASSYYSMKCAICHGEKGAGDGPGGAGQDPSPTNFTRGSWQATVSDTAIYTAILGGGVAVGKSAGMPPNPDLQDQPLLANDLVLLVREFSVLYAVGDTADGVAYSLVVVEAKECPPSAPYFEPKPGNRHVGVNVVITAVAADGVPVNPYNGTLTDSAGATYWPTVGAECKPELVSGYPAKGESMGGWISFEVPNTSTGLRFHYWPVKVGATEVSVEIGYPI